MLVIALTSLGILGLLCGGGLFAAYLMVFGL